MHKSKFILSLLVSSVLLSGCVGAAIGAGAALGVSAAREGGLQTSIKDEAIRIKISEAWFSRDTEMFGKLNLTVNQGRVLVTGVVQNPEDRVEAIRLAWQQKGVKQVINEVRVGNANTVGSFANDTWIAGQLRTRLTFDKYIQSINYSIEVVQGTVYLMGVAQNQQELDKVIQTARRIKGVKEVISYVKLAGVEADIGAVEAGGYVEPVRTNNSVDNKVPSNQQPTSITPEPLTYDSMPKSTSSSIQSEVLPP
jgi:osmotically-inducible protein OsmY